jgi:hypothetical protein
LRRSTAGGCGPQRALSAQARQRTAAFALKSWKSQIVALDSIGDGFEVFDPVRADPDANPPPLS